MRFAVYQSVLWMLASLCISFLLNYPHIFQHISFRHCFFVHLNVFYTCRYGFFFFFFFFFFSFLATYSLFFFKLVSFKFNVSLRRLFFTGLVTMLPSGLYTRSLLATRPLRQVRLLWIFFFFKLFVAFINVPKGF